MGLDSLIPGPPEDTSVEAKMTREIMRLERECADYAMLVGRLSRLLTGIADGLRGPQELVMRDWSHLPEDAEEIRQILLECHAEVVAGKPVLSGGAVYASAVRKLWLHLEIT